MVLDAKYKEISVADHYQMLNYIDEFQVQSGALVRPCSVGESANMISHRTTTGSQVDVLSLELSDVNSALNELSSYVISKSR